MNLIEGLQQEIKRVNEIIEVYDEVPAGAFASAMMKGSIKRAEKSISEVNTIEMLRCLEDLKEYEL